MTHWTDQGLGGRLAALLHAAWHRLRVLLAGRGGPPPTGPEPPSRKPGDTPTPPGFLNAVAEAEQKTPLPPPPPPMPDEDDPKYADDPAAYQRDKQQAEAAASAFAEAAKRRGAAVGAVVSDWLGTAPYVMLQELLDQPRDRMPVFKPAVGPVIVMRHPEVIRCLERTDLFTVDPYAAEMARATDDPSKHPGAYSHFMLGTDNDALYRPDDVLLRRVVARSDGPMLAALAREEAERCTRGARELGTGEIDVVKTLGKFVPLRIVADYLGVPFSESGQPSVLPGLRGGDPFPLDTDLLDVFSFRKIQQGLVPTSDDLYGWVKDAFRNIFNNFNPASPLFQEFRERGLIATEYLSAYIHALIRCYKARLMAGEPVPDTMLTRLLRLQLQVSRGEGETLGQDLAALLGAPLPEGELARRLSDSMVRSNVFGTVVGAVVNPQEATGRMADSMLRLQEGHYRVLNDATYQQAVHWASVAEDTVEYPRSLERLRKYALEALRLQPQGEVLLRRCAKDNTELGVPIRQGTPVFVAYAAAMRDPEVIAEPLAFDITRDERLSEYLADRERHMEAPQSQLYLQHGYGRHKCLGRYASEVTLLESLRALLRLGALERRSPLQMDAQNLYAESLRVGWS